jgi:hypothetical protein
MLARRAKNSGRQNVGTRFASHRKWVRGHVCAVAGPDCGGDIECAHIESSGTGGMGMKAHDAFTIPLCNRHHAERHRIGWRTFDNTHRLDALELAKELAAKSPHIRRAASEAGYSVGEEVDA